MRGKVTAVVGTKWGDEGKGKIIDYLAQKADIVARATGGSNAGHRVVINGKAYPLHLLPSGVFNPNAKIVIGNGVYVDPVVLYKEIKALEDDGIEVLSRLYISEKAHVVMPFHPVLDEYEESLRENKIGTTKRGMGPVAQDKYGRFGTRMLDFVSAKQDVLHSVVDDQISYASRMKCKLENERIGLEIAMACGRSVGEYEEAIKVLGKRVCDTISLVHQWLEAGENLLIEGAQATLLDIDAGSYPFTTSSNPIASGMCTGVAIGPTYLSKVIGVLKAYDSRVGEGPFLTEDTGVNGSKIRELGHEYGTTTGRPRRCGWLDLVALNYSCRVNGLTGLAVNHLDTIGNFAKIKVCVAYKNFNEPNPVECEINNDERRTVPYVTKEFTSEVQKLKNCEPIYEELDGNFGDISKVRRFKDLPKNAQNYLQFIADYTGVPILYVGVGPGREDLIKCNLKPTK